MQSMSLLKTSAIGVSERSHAAKTFRILEDMARAPPIDRTMRRILFAAHVLIR